jgi:hypothetical protein
VDGEDFARADKMLPDMLLVLNAIAGRTRNHRLNPAISAVTARPACSRSKTLLMCFYRVVQPGKPGSVHGQSKPACNDRDVR